VVLEGRDENDPLILQAKEATASVMEPFVASSGHENHAQRVVVGQQLMQATSDIFLGWTRGPGGRDYYLRQLWDTPHGGFICLDWTANQDSGLRPGDRDRPLLVRFHGLEGSSNSHYARALMHAAAGRGWQGVVVHFRGCSGEINRLPRAYHSGDSAEIDWILRRLRTLHAHGPLFAVGVSLGGNALLKWLGEQGGCVMEV